MKPLRIRFENFACFEECSLALEPGVQILVGKNNSGKTALLRGLTALASLPIGQPMGSAFDVGKYARHADQSGFDFRVEFEFEDKDFSVLGGALSQWPAAQKASTRLLEFRFRVLGGENAVGFSGASLKLDENELEVLTRNNQIVIQHHYNQNGDRGGAATQLRTKTQRQVQSQNWPVLEEAPIFSALMPLKNVRLIDAHRVVRPELNMQAVDALTPNAESLAPFLDTLFGNNRRKFEQVEELVTRVFPEIESVNPEKRGNSVSLTLTTRQAGRAIPLTHCGTGVEQVLALATFVLTAPSGTMLLLDEPHSYLHPSAEREIIDFLLEHSEHRYVIATHSAILINSVSPDKIVRLNSPKVIPTGHVHPHTGDVLHSLGYRNSDFLFSDRLIFVEGESDQEILPALLEKSGEFKKSDISRTGFPKMDGEGRLRSTAKQTSLLYFEKFLLELGSSSLPRIYLFDGDCSEEDERLLQGTHMVAENEKAAIKFLPRCEIENYLLVPEAITKGIRNMAQMAANDVSMLTEEAVSKQLQELLAANDGKLFPTGKGNDSLRSIKGSIVLERIFESFGLKYRKRNEGRLVAEYITETNQSALREIWDLVRPIFPQRPPKGRF